jgi:hypothetical protein
LELLRERGPSPEAFTFRVPFPAPDGSPTHVDDDWMCPA